MGDAVKVPVRMRVERPISGPPVADEFVDTTWCFDRGQPWQIAVDLSADGDDNVWVFARDLLAAGLGGPAGLGDVQFLPAAGKVWLRLSGDDGCCVLSARRKDLAGFLAASFELVPAGCESRFVDLDRTIGMLTGGGPC